MASQQSRGGTFEVGQVAAGNEPLMLAGSSRPEQEEGDAPAHPQAGGGVEGRGDGREGWSRISLNQTCKWDFFFFCTCLRVPV